MCSIARLRSLRVQLLLWIALPVAIILFALSLTELRSHERAMARLVQERADNWTQAAAAFIGMRLDRERDRLLQLTAVPFFHTRSPATWPQFLADFQDGFPAGLAVWNRSGQLVTRTEAASWADDPAVRDQLMAQIQAGESGSITWWPTPDGPLLILAVATPATDGEFWMVAGALPVSALNLAEIPQVLSPGDYVALEIADETGTPVFSLARADGPPDAGKVVLSTVQIPLARWQVALHVSWAELAPPVLRFENLVFLVVAAAAAISLGSAYFGLRNIVYPLRRLNKMAISIGWGDFDAAEAPVGGVQEIEDLRLALDDMAHRLRQYQQELQSYIGAITMGQEEERRRLARELHDGTVQMLIALNQQAELVERWLPHQPEEALLRVKELRPWITATLAELRRQIHALRPLYLEDLGFIPALEMLVRQVGERHHLVVDFEVSGTERRRLDPAVEISAYRIVQEALQNVAAHAHATWAHVELVFDAHGITIRIEDNGRGFEVPVNPSRLAQQGHLGLLGIRERAQLHGGWLRLYSEPGQGTALTVRLLDQADDTCPGSG